MLSVVPCKFVEIMTLLDLQASGFRLTVARCRDTLCLLFYCKDSGNKQNRVENGQIGPKRKYNCNFL